jgi:hypothetical protein
MVFGRFWKRPFMLPWPRPVGCPSAKDRPRIWGGLFVRQLCRHLPQQPILFVARRALIGVIAVWTNFILEICPLVLGDRSTFKHSLADANHAGGHVHDVMPLDARAEVAWCRAFMPGVSRAPCAIGAPLGKGQWRAPLRHAFFLRRAGSMAHFRLRHRCAVKNGSMAHLTTASFRCPHTAR